MRNGGHNREVVIEQRGTTQDPLYGTAIENDWTTVATVMAEVQDMLPSRAERIEEGISVRQRPTRIRMNYRDDIDSSMRLRVKARSPQEADRLLSIIAGPAELGFRRRMEFVAVEWSTQGQEP